jgi:hypothetical protein
VAAKPTSRAARLVNTTKGRACYSATPDVEFEFKRSRRWYRAGRSWSTTLRVLEKNGGWVADSHGDGASGARAYPWGRRTACAAAEPEGNYLDFREMARPEGFEPPTPTFVALYSIQLSYGRALPRNFGGRDLTTSDFSHKLEPPREEHLAAADQAV